MVILTSNNLIKSEQLIIKFAEDLLIFTLSCHVCVSLKDECSLDKVKVLLPGHDGHERLSVLRGATPTEKEIQKIIVFLKIKLFLYKI